MDGFISLAVVLVFFVALFTGSLGSPAGDTPRDLVFREETKHVSSLSEQELINAVVTAEQRAANATLLYDLLENRSDFFVMNSKKGTQVLRLRCWGSYQGKPAHVSGDTVFLGNRYETFRTTVQPEMKDGHSLLLKITGDGRVLFSRALTAGSGAFQLELDVRGVQYFTLQISSDNHSGSMNPGIYLKNALFF